MFNLKNSSSLEENLVHYVSEWCTVNMWCDQAKWVGICKYYFKDIAKQSR